MIKEDTYRTIESVSEGLYKEKGSKFLAYAYPIETIEQVKPLHQTLIKQHHTARHHCYAYRIGINEEQYRINDDGEPSGTAGKPIYGQIVSYELTNIIIIVVRYFGGTLLGVSGLIRAYKSAAQDAIENASVIEKIVSSKLKLRFGYEQMNTVMRIVKEEQLAIVMQDFQEDCKLVLSVRDAMLEAVTQRFDSIHKVELNP